MNRRSSGRAAPGERIPYEKGRSATASRRQMHAATRKIQKGLGRGFVSAALGALVRPVRRRSLAGLRPLARRLAWLVRTTTPARHRMAREHMALVLGDRYTPRDYRRMAATATYNLVLTGLELLKMPTLSREQITAATRIEGLERLRDALAAGRGCLMVTAHFGSWELGGAALAAAGIPMTVIGSFASRGALLVNEAREALGVQVLEPEDLRGMLRALRQGRCLAILPDLSHVTRKSVVVDFMGRPALTAVGVPLLAQRSGCPVVPTFCPRQEDGTCLVRVFPALELSHTGVMERHLRENAALFNRVIGEQIAEHPDQWLWLHNRWKVYPELMSPASE